jgi:hypothetical protein
VQYINIERKNPVAASLSTYVDALAQTGSHDAAFKEAFGTDIEGMEKELRDYVRQVSLNGLMIDVDAAGDDRVQSEASAKPTCTRFKRGFSWRWAATTKPLRNWTRRSNAIPTTCLQEFRSGV